MVLCFLNLSSFTNDDYDPYVPPIPFVNVDASYVRRGDNFIPIGCFVMSYDPVSDIWFPDDADLGPFDVEIDFCDVVEWSDNGAGGEFGYFDSEGDWVPHNGPLTTHYRTARWDDESGRYVPIEPQIVRISVCVDDDGDGYHLADDPPQWSLPENDGYFTIWEFEIDPPYIDSLPQDGATYTFTATIRPATDHNGNSMARIIEFGLGSSSEPGYCLNATRIQGLWTDTSAEDNDLKFVPDQPGLEVYAEGANQTNFCHAVTTQPVITASVQVRCLDYGAYGSVWAYAYGLGLARWKGTMIEGGAQIPLDQRDGLDNDGDGQVDEDLVDVQDNDGDGRIDEDAQGNYIYDGWQWNNGAATDDNDPEPQNQLPPANQPRPGDGFSRYEEYRGFIVQGNHKRLSPNVKDVFIYNPHNLDIGGFATLGLQIHLIRHDEFDAVFDRPTDNDVLWVQGGDGRVDEDPLDGVDNDGDGRVDEDPADEEYPIVEQSTFIINRFWRTANVTIQRAIALLYHPAYLLVSIPPPAQHPPLGAHGASLPGRPPFALIYIRQIRHYTDPNRYDRVIDPRDPVVIRFVVAHELGNIVNLSDHGGVTTRQCFMYDTNNSYENANHDPVPNEYCATNPGCRLLFFLK